MSQLTQVGRQWTCPMRFTNGIGEAVIDIPPSGRPHDVREVRICAPEGTQRVTGHAARLIAILLYDKSEGRNG